LIHLATNKTHYQNLMNTVKNGRIPVEGRGFLDMSKSDEVLCFEWLVRLLIISAGGRVPYSSFWFEPRTTEAPPCDGNSLHSGLSTT